MLSLDFEIADGLTLYDLVRDRRQDVEPVDESKAESIKRVKAAMRGLSEPHYQLLGLILDGQDDEQICTALRCRRRTLDTTKVAMIRALKHIIGAPLISSADLESMPGFREFDSAMRKILSLSPEQAAAIRGGHGKSEHL